jgi:hypothetical protein
VSTFLDLQFSFDKAYVPGVLDWQNPWDNPSYKEENWSVVEFNNSSLTGNCLGFSAEEEKVAFALKFEQLPDWGDVGALKNRQIDAFRFQYNFSKISFGKTESFAYSVITFADNGPIKFQQLNNPSGLFDFKPSSTIQLNSRDYRDNIAKENIKFIVYDKNQLDTKIINGRLLELVYSNDRYVIFKIRSPS